MKKVLMIIILGVILLSAISFSSAIQGVCTGTQTCFCSGKAVSCPCDADPCVICGPASPECMEAKGTQQTPAGQGSGETGSSNYYAPQAPGDFIGLIGNGLSNLILTAFGQPLVVNGQVQTETPDVTERILAVIALTAIFIAVGAILKFIFAKIFTSKAGGTMIMSKAQPSRRNPTLPTGELSWSPRYNRRDSYKPKRGPEYEKA